MASPFARPRPWILPLALLTLALPIPATSAGSPLQRRLPTPSEDRAILQVEGLPKREAIVFTYVYQVRLGRDGTMPVTPGVYTWTRLSGSGRTRSTGDVWIRAATHVRFICDASSPRCWSKEL